MNSDIVFFKLPNKFMIGFLRQNVSCYMKSVLTCHIIVIGCSRTAAVTWASRSWKSSAKWTVTVLLLLNAMTLPD